MPSPIEKFDERHADFLRDESRKTGSAESVALPRTEDGVAEVLRECGRAGTPVTLQGSRTGITGGAVPAGGCILNLSRMDRVTGLRHDKSTGRFHVTAQPGVRLADLAKALHSREFVTGGWSPESLSALEALRKAGLQFLPVDPTETTASVGGMVACNASGSRALLYGATRAHVSALRLVFADGSMMRVARGEHRAQGRAFSLGAFRGNLPTYHMPAVKNAAGYYAADGMDLLDLFVGMEGTLAVVSEVELRLTPVPACIWGLTAFMPSEEAGLKLVRALREGDAAGGEGTVELRPAALEYFNGDALGLLRRQKECNPAFAALPEIAPQHAVALYAEYHGTEEQVSAAAEEAGEAVEDLGGDAETVWLASEEREIERMKFFRHAVPESVNLCIDERRKTEPSITKLGTDMAVPSGVLAETVAMYNRDLDAAGLESVVFGHVGDNHLHVNILPRTVDEYRAGRELYLRWARKVTADGGSVSAEHGIGKLKTGLLQIMYGEQGVAEMRAVKRVFDPDGILNRGNLFAWE